MPVAPITEIVAEMKAGRSEYEDHSRSLTDFKQAAEAGRQTP